MLPLKPSSAFYECVISMSFPLQMRFTDPRVSEEAPSVLKPTRGKCQDAFYFGNMHSFLMAAVNVLSLSCEPIGGRIIIVFLLPGM